MRPGATRETTDGRVYNISGGDWDDVVGDARDERILLNFGPQHPSSHGVLRLALELEGETITDCRPVVGYLHTGIEKNTEYRTWTQGVTFLPAGQSYTTVESPRGILGAHVVSDGGTRPYRVHLREPSFVNIQCLPALTEGGMLSDVIACVASVDSLMGGCDR